jgi:hypothetical protein
MPENSKGEGLEYAMTRKTLRVGDFKYATTGKVFRYGKINSRTYTPHGKFGQRLSEHAKVTEGMISLLVRFCFGV